MDDIGRLEKVEFRPFRMQKGEIVLTPNKQEIEILFNENLVSKSAKDLDQLKDLTKKMLAGGYDYLLDIVGQDFPYLSRRLVVEFIDSEKLMHQGILMRLGVRSLRKHLEKPEDKYQRDLVQSLILHELVHNLTDDEDFPMSIEMIYMLEKGHIGRIRQIKEFLEKGRLTKRHQEGLDNISKWLGHESATGMLKVLPETNLASLKQVFKQRIEDYCRDEF